ncbi:MAG TPA: endonuclease/exonuclease/phosphatase family protein [Actinomycetota bacterium]|jgi:exonuclease III|nr:endonuclease/exonuclease/phosphatase family protein [Actinomycetota bacterium]
MTDRDGRGRGEQLAILTPGTPPQPRDAETADLRLVTWNVQHAAPTRARRQAAWLAGQPEADVVVLTEVKDAPGGDALLQALGEHGYHAVVPTQAGGDYMSVVAARAHALEAVPDAVEFLPHRLVTVHVRVGARTVGVTGLYVPSRGPRERRNLDKRAFQQAVSAYLPRLAAPLDGGLAVVAGDLNVVEPDHRPRYGVFGDWEYRFYADFADLGGLVDAFRELHPGRVEHSWFGRGGNGYRFDHVFVTRRHRRQLRTCRYLHEPRRVGLSDHAAMAVTLALDLDADLDEPGTC